MAALYESGRDPVTGARLGRPYPTFRPVDDRIADRVARLPGDLSEQERAEQVAEIEADERARPVRAAVAGFRVPPAASRTDSLIWAGTSSQRRSTAQTQW